MLSYVSSGGATCTFTLNDGTAVNINRRDVDWAGTSTSAPVETTDPVAEFIIKGGKYAGKTLQYVSSQGATCSFKLVNGRTVSIARRDVDWVGTQVITKEDIPDGYSYDTHEYYIHSGPHKGTIGLYKSSVSRKYCYFEDAGGKQLSILRKNVCWTQYFNSAPTKDKTLVKVKKTYLSDNFLDSYLAGTYLEYKRPAGYKLDVYKPINLPAHIYYKFMDEDINPMAVYLNKRFLIWDVEYPGRNSVKI
tara:strand:+ start:2622 stop:3365 length:744 start_codon:yes stop_codon:yes gene_type:complete